MRTRIIGTLVAGIMVAVTSGSPVEAADGPAVRAARCWDLGTTFGSAYSQLDQRLRARGTILENYCRAQKDPVLKRIPSDEDAQSVAREIMAAVRPPSSNARIKTAPLDSQIREGATEEGQMLDQLLK